MARSRNLSDLSPTAQKVAIRILTVVATIAVITTALVIGRLITVTG